MLDSLNISEYIELAHLIFEIDPKQDDFLIECLHKIMGKLEDLSLSYYVELWMVLALYNKNKINVEYEGIL